MLGMFVTHGRGMNEAFGIKKNGVLMDKALGWACWRHCQGYAYSCRVCLSSKKDYNGVWTGVILTMIHMAA